MPFETLSACHSMNYGWKYRPVCVFCSRLTPATFTAVRFLFCPLCLSLFTFTPFRHTCTHRHYVAPTQTHLSLNSSQISAHFLSFWHVFKSPSVSEPFDDCLYCLFQPYDVFAARTHTCACPLLYLWLWFRPVLIPLADSGVDIRQVFNYKAPLKEIVEILNR